MRHWKICKTNRCPFYYRVYKTSSREFKRHGQSILPIYNIVVVVVVVVVVFVVVVVVVVVYVVVAVVYN